MVDSNVKTEKCCEGLQPPTPVKQMKFIKDLLWACSGCVDEWYIMFGGNEDPEKALKLIRNELKTLMYEAAKCHGDEEIPIEEERIDPAVCYTRYYTCVALPGPNCAGELQKCLITKRKK